jgi:hypothetical protein
VASEGRDHRERQCDWRFLLLALQRPIARFTGYVTVFEGIFTAWLPAWLLFQGYLKM